MNEPPAHGQQQVLDILKYAGHLQGMNAPVGQRQIDGSARFRGTLSGIGAAFVEFHPVAAALQKDGEQHAGGARADDANGGPIGVHRRTARDRASTAANTSPNEL